MLRVLTLSTLYPDVSRPTFGGFVERQTRGLAGHPAVELQVVAPVGLPPWPLSRHPRFQAMAGLPTREVWEGVTVHRPRFIALPGTQGRFNATLLTRALKRYLKRVRREFAFDVIDASFFYPDGPAAVALGRAFGVPVSIKARGSDVHVWGAASATGGQIVAAGRAADGLLAVSAAMRADMIALGMPDHIRVHYTGVDQDRFALADRAAAKAALGLAGPVVISTGTLNERKGHHIVMRALAYMPDATLLLVGAGPDRAMLEQLAGQLGMADRVRFLGTMPHEALPGLLAAADVFALASVSEGLANAWVEALACGVPIVIAPAGGAAEVVTGPDAGRIVVRTPEAFAGAIRELLAAPPEPAAVRVHAAPFTWAANTAALYDHLSGLVRR